MDELYVAFLKLWFDYFLWPISVIIDLHISREWRSWIEKKQWHIECFLITKVFSTLIKESDFEMKWIHSRHLCRLEQIIMSLILHHTWFRLTHHMKSKLWFSSRENFHVMNESFDPCHHLWFLQNKCFLIRDWKKSLVWMNLLFVICICQFVRCDDQITREDRQWLWNVDWLMGWGEYNQWVWEMKTIFPTFDPSLFLANWKRGNCQTVAF
jgi:hypothetical protein